MKTQTKTTKTENAKSGTLSFWTTGEAYTNLLFDLYTSGEFEKFEKLLGGGNLKEEQKVLAFKLQLQLTGDTREGDLSCKFLSEPPKDFSKTLYFAIKSAFQHHLNDDFLELEWEVEKGGKKDSEGFRGPNINLSVLTKYISIEEIYQICRNEILDEHGYGVTEQNPLYKISNGVILSDGSLIECGYQDHINLYPVLNTLNLADSSEWTRCENTIHISSGQLHGSVIHNIEHPELGKSLHIQPQIDTLFRVCRSFEVYGSFDRATAAELVRNLTVVEEDKGTKYGNLEFLRKYYPEVKLPKFSKNSDDLKPFSSIFLRTSPKESLPGLLNSRLVANNLNKIRYAIREVEDEFEKFKYLTEQTSYNGKKFNRNQIHWFFQEFLEGPNGVCQFIGDTKSSANFSYQLSKSQGDIVGGKKGDTILEFETENKLRRLTRSLADDLKSDLQLEFVIHEEEIYVVQLRLLEGTPSNDSNHLPEDIEVLSTGRSFSKGYLESVSVSDILIVEEDAKSEELLGKKALIVKSDIAFSHILALSKALKIPSIYALQSEVDFNSLKEVSFNSNSITGIISKSK